MDRTGIRCYCAAGPPAPCQSPQHQKAPWNRCSCCWSCPPHVRFWPDVLRMSQGRTVAAEKKRISEQRTRVESGAERFLVKGPVAPHLQHDQDAAAAVPGGPHGSQSLAGRAGGTHGGDWEQQAAQGLSGASQRQDARGRAATHVTRPCRLTAFGQRLQADDEPPLAGTRVLHKSITASGIRLRLSRRDGSYPLQHLQEVQQPQRLRRRLTVGCRR